MALTFQLQHTDPNSDARTGLITTAHGQIKTPIFMPVGTCGSVKGVPFRALREQVKAQIILGNTYHLYLRPGLSILEQAGGLHKFNGFDRPMLTDSGGFQVFSLAAMNKIREDGVEFHSHIDGRKLFFTPEYVMEIEQALGADIAMAFDECAPADCDKSYAAAAMNRTHRWAERCKASHTREDQALFGIVQGGMFRDLRIESAKVLSDMDFPGYGIGGLSVGEPKPVMYEMLEELMPYMPVNKPHYLMGVGSPDCLVEGAMRGIDMFDCVLPTRISRNGTAFTSTGKVVVKNGKYKEKFLL